VVVVETTVNVECDTEDVAVMTTVDVEFEVCCGGVIFVIAGDVETGVVVVVIADCDGSGVRNRILGKARKVVRSLF